MLLIIIILSSCNATRYLTEDQSLVDKIELIGVDNQFKETALTFVQSDIRTNSRLNLALYNTFNTRHGQYKTGKVKAIGEAPHLLDSSLVEISRVQIEKFLSTKGFFNAKVNSEIEIKDKLAKIKFIASQGPEFKIRKIAYQIPDSAVLAIYERERKTFSRLHEGSRFDFDSLAFEREQIYRLLKKNGYFDYVRQYVRFDVDSNLYGDQADLKLFLTNPEGKNAHQVYTIDNSQVSIRTSQGKFEGLSPDTLKVDSQFHFIDYSGKFKPKTIKKYIFLKPDELYSLEKEELTYNRLYDLNVFRNLKIEYVKTGDSTNKLNPRYDISPLKQMSNRIEGEYTFNAGRNGFNIGNTYTNRNLFGGAELLEVRAKYGVLFDAASSKNLLDGVFSRDLQLGINLIIPKLLVPFKIPDIGKNGMPHTTISSSIQSFDQRDAFRSRVFINSIAYDWVETKSKFHSYTPINIEFRKGVLDPVFRDSLLQRGFGLYVKTNDRQFFNLGSQYTFSYNANKLESYSNFLFFRAEVDFAGNSLGILDKLVKFKKDNDGFRTIFGLPYQQYVKTEFDIRYYRYFDGDKQFVARINPGIGIAYGNSEILTFEKNFFAGGSSGVRAWQARTLGPGNYNREVLGTDGKADTLRANLRNLDQLGEYKLEGNLEYRFKIANNVMGAKVKGATFADFGNIWRRRESVENPGGEFEFSKLFSQLAVGLGAGLRFDLNYFVFRLDAGLKVKDPQFIGADQYVLKYLFNKKEFKADYADTHRPDVYRLVQYNFGIGMPF